MCERRAQLVDVPGHVIYGTFNKDASDIEHAHKSKVLPALKLVSDFEVRFKFSLTSCPCF